MRRSRAFLRSALLAGVGAWATPLAMGCGLPLDGRGIGLADAGSHVPDLRDIVDGATTPLPTDGAYPSDAVAPSEADAGDVSDDGEARPHGDGGDGPDDGSLGREARRDGARVEDGHGEVSGSDGGPGGGAGDSGPPDFEAGADSPVPATSMFVQSNYVTPMSPRQSVSVAYPMGQARGHLNVVVVGWNDSQANVTSVSDSAGNLYALAAGPVVYSGLLTQSVYYAANIANAPTNRVDVQFDKPAQYIDLRVLEYGGVDPQAPVDTAAGASGNDATATVGPVNTTAADLLVAATTVITNVVQASDDFTLRILTSPNGDSVADRVSTAAGPFESSAVLGSPGEWVMQIVAFRAQ